MDQVKPRVRAMQPSRSNRAARSAKTAQPRWHPEEWSKPVVGGGAAGRRARQVPYA